MEHFEEIAPRIGEEGDAETERWYIVGFAHDVYASTLQSGDEPSLLSRGSSGLQRSQKVQELFTDLGRGFVLDPDQRPAGKRERLRI